METFRNQHVLTLSGLCVLTLTLAVLMTGCATESAPAPNPPANAGNTPAPEESSTTSEGNGSNNAHFHIGEMSFEFTPTLCILSDEDVMVQGPGTHTQTGEVAFLDVDFTIFEGDFVGGADIELGIDEPFSSPDDFYRLDPLVNDEGFDLIVEGGSATAQGLFYLHNLEGVSLRGDDVGQGVIEVSCNAS